MLRVIFAGAGLLVLGLLGGCQTSSVGPSTMRGAEAYSVIPARQDSAQARDYVIGPLDTLNVTVFQEADLSIQGLVVDASGGISLPLVGRVDAKNLTATELGHQIEDRLRGRFLRRPQVTVVVASSVSQRVTVQGQVEQPGIYPLQGPTTLLDAVALAHGETRLAATNEVVVIRHKDGQRLAAVFDLRRIRRGESADPEIVGNDVVVVGYSNLSGAWRDALQSIPLIAIFRVF